MRVYAEPGYGLSDIETEALRRLSPRSRALILDELGHPDSHGTIQWVLRQRDPERALANAVAENVHQATIDVAAGGLSDGLGRSFFKRLARLHRKIFNRLDPIRKIAFGGKKKHRGGAPIVSQPAAAAATPASTDASSTPPLPPPQPPPPPLPSPVTYAAPPDSTSSYSPPPQGPVNYVQEQPPPDVASPQAMPPDAPPVPLPAQVAPPPTPAAAPSYAESTDETTGLPSAGGYTLTVEGQTITNYPVPLGTLSSLVQSGTQPGDRFEILADGVGTGLRVRTAGGFIAIPDSIRAQVMAMPHDQVLALLTQAAANVAAAGGPDGPAPVPTPASSGGGTTAVLLAILGGGAALVASKGKRR
jgi:hypothetical protein